MHIWADHALARPARKRMLGLGSLKSQERVTWCVSCRGFRALKSQLLPPSRVFLTTWWDTTVSYVRVRIGAISGVPGNHDSSRNTAISSIILVIRASAARLAHQLCRRCGGPPLNLPYRRAVVQRCGKARAGGSPCDGGRCSPEHARAGAK